MITSKKILILGSEIADTDVQTSKLAEKNGMLNYGLIQDKNFVPNAVGFYHTSVADLSPGQIINLVKSHFDLAILLDQPVESYPHYKSFVTTLRLAYDMESEGLPVNYRKNKSSQNFLKWKAYLQENKTFCFYPFLAVIDSSDKTFLCNKTRIGIKRQSEIHDWKTDPDYLKIRNDMINGVPNSLCQDCYSREQIGEESTRQYETLEWTQKLQYQTPNDFLNILSPLYYEIRPSNICNIMCRTCDDGHSHLIEKEYKKIKIPLVNWKFKNAEFDKIPFESLQRLYVAGGEPTIMPEFYEFLRKCIKYNKTNIELNIGTNGMKISETLLSLLDNFSHVCFSFSFDGYKKVNDYIRWGSDFDTIVENSRRVRERGHIVGLQTVFSIYSLSRMDELFKFYDQEYSGSGLLVQVALGQDDCYMPFHHPLPEVVISSLQKCKDTEIYFMNGRSIKSMIDSLVVFYSNPNYKCNLSNLKKFYDFNDKLDMSRNSKLADYIPELAEARKIYNL